LEDEINHWREQRVDVVVSLLVPDEVQEFNLEQERKYCEQTGISFRSLHIVDREVPSSIEDARRLVRKVALDLGVGKSVVVHCRQGIGRSGLIAIAALMQAGQKLDDSIALVSRARGREVPETPEQLAWLRAFASGSGGTQETQSAMLK
jgi:protein-tyrosine phosphatase